MAHGAQQQQAGHLPSRYEGRQRGESERQRVLIQTKKGSSPSSVCFGQGVTSLSLRVLIVQEQEHNLPPVPKNRRADGRIYVKRLPHGRCWRKCISCLLGMVIVRDV